MGGAAQMRGGKRRSRHGAVRQRSGREAPLNVRHADLAGPRLDIRGRRREPLGGERGARRGSSFGRPGVLEFVIIAVVPRMGRKTRPFEGGCWRVDEASAKTLGRAEAEATETRAALQID